MGITHILVLAALLRMDSVAPKIVAPFKSQEECFIAANRLNRETAELRKPGAREKGLAFVCLRVVLPV
jgi:hypothetical protein